MADKPSNLNKLDQNIEKARACDSDANAYADRLRELAASEPGILAALAHKEHLIDRAADIYYDPDGHIGGTKSVFGKRPDRDLNNAIDRARDMKARLCRAF